MRKRLNLPGLEPVTWNLEGLRGCQLDHRGDRYMSRTDMGGIWVQRTVELHEGRELQRGSEVRLDTELGLEVHVLVGVGRREVYDADLANKKRSKTTRYVPSVRQQRWHY